MKPLMICCWLWVSGVLPVLGEDAAVLFEEDFEKGRARWTTTEQSAWRLAPTDGGHAFELTKKRSAYQPPHRSPHNMALADDLVVSDFEFRVQVRTTEPSYGHRSLCLFFGYQDPANFYYVHLGQETDNHANQIFIVNDAPRVKISSKTTKGTPWQENHWHEVMIRRDVASGSIKVYFDDMNHPVMEATNKEFTWGKVGIGSFDDRGMFDKVQVSGKRVPLIPKKMDAAVAGHQYRYWLHTPVTAPPVEGYPLLLFLHGAGERGDDLEKVKVHGPPKLLAKGAMKSLESFVVIAPQCPTKTRWQPETLKVLIDEVCRSGANIDLSRLYVTGLSMGGYGTWGLLSNYPDTFAAAIPICGGGDFSRLKISKDMGLENQFSMDDLMRAKQVPIWAFHGDNDGTVPPEESRLLVDALKAAGSESVKLTIYPGVGHDSWTQTYANPAVYAWLREHQKP